MTARRILVTGATSGIGAAITRRLLGEGHHVVGIGRDFGKLDCADHECFEAVVLDLADLDALPGRLDRLIREHSDLDGVVLAAGKGDLASLEQFSYQRIRQLIDLNFTSQAFVARACLPTLKRRGRGDIVFIGSEAALEGKRQGTAYCASKFALRGFAQALRDESSKSGVRVSQIHPGMVRTPFFDDLPIEPGPEPEHALESDEVAQAVSFVLGLRPGVVVDEIRLNPLKHVVVKG